MLPEYKEVDSTKTTAGNRYRAHLTSTGGKMLGSVSRDQNRPEEVLSNAEKCVSTERNFRNPAGNRRGKTQTGFGSWGGETQSSSISSTDARHLVDALIERRQAWICRTRFQATSAYCSRCGRPAEAVPNKIGFFSREKKTERNTWKTARIFRASKRRRRTETVDELLGRAGRRGGQSISIEPIWAPESQDFSASELGTLGGWTGIGCAWVRAWPGEISAISLWRKLSNISPTNIGHRRNPAGECTHLHLISRQARPSCTEFREFYPA